MRKARFLIVVIVVCSCVVFWGSGLPGVYAGDLEPPPSALGPSGQPVSTMHTLDEIYNLIDERCPAIKEAGVPRTGQTTSYATRDDGDLRLGTPWPNPRFLENGDGTVTDELTGLIWLKNLQCVAAGVGLMWTEALAFANSLHDGWTGDGSGGDCGLSDGSSASDWRLPNVRELHSLIDFRNRSPALPSGHPFTEMIGHPYYYWSSTTVANISSNLAWIVDLTSGRLWNQAKEIEGYVWPVRGGNY